MNSVLVDHAFAGPASLRGLDAPLAIMPRLKWRGALKAPPRQNAAAGQEQGGQSLVGTESTDHSAPTAEILQSWLRAVAERQDRDAFARLHRHFAPRLAGFLARSGLSQAQAEDIIQDTMLAVWRKAALYDRSQGGVSTWVFVIARNLRIDHRRRKANRDTLPLDDWDQIDEGPSGEDMLLSGERESRVRSALAQLTPEQAQALQQAYFADKPQSAIARDLGVPLGTVKSRVRLALARMRKILEDTP
jgi:RNA polymerase sigma-70 factor, ECF subfamily